MLSILKLLNKNKMFISFCQTIIIISCFYWFIALLKFLPFTKGKYGSVLKEFIKIDIVQFLLWLIFISFLMIFLLVGFWGLFDLFHWDYGKNAITCILLNKKIFFYLAILFTCICSLEKDKYSLIVTTLSFVQILFFTQNVRQKKKTKKKRHKKLS